MPPPTTGQSSSASSSQNPALRSNHTPPSPPSSYQSATLTEGSAGTPSGTDRSIGNSIANSTSPSTHTIDTDAQANRDGQAQRTSHPGVTIQRYEDQDPLEGPFPESSVQLPRRYSALNAAIQRVDDVFQRR